MRDEIGWTPDQAAAIAAVRDALDQLADRLNAAHGVGLHAALLLVVHGEPAEDQEALPLALESTLFATHWGYATLYRIAWALGAVCADTDDLETVLKAVLKGAAEGRERLGTGQPQ